MLAYAAHLANPVMYMEEIVVPRLTRHRVPAALPVADIVEDASKGLIKSPRSMPPKYFYDERGSQLFDAICETREYYPTRTEEALLRSCAHDVITQLRPDHIVEFGSGTARKTRHLFDACDRAGETAAYWPFDVCEEMLHDSGQKLVQEYDWLQVNTLVGDYLGGLTGLPPREGRCLYLFLGGTIGNFTEDEAATFLDEVRAIMRPGDGLLLGADRVKDSEVLHAAYNDDSGITAQFNLNLLHVLNRELDADFCDSNFEHRALFNTEASRIEMYLVSRRRQSVRIKALEHTLELEAGEKILTEISRKFTPANLESLLNDAGLAVQRHFEPDNGWFSLVLAEVEGAPVTQS
ncbi:Dimethylhistidine N-methyltransferase [hydrothermal vent metagenome]|uniref:Dimethylhistidine N-methyltransferase n=1 Tax=hydrothermal vent metagenome TaxID=652676 RepID=A0A3B0YQ72_9ZZZZ